MQNHSTSFRIKFLRLSENTRTHIQSNPKVPLTLATPDPNQELNASLRELETEIMELKSLVLGKCFRKQSGL